MYVHFRIVEYAVIGEKIVSGLERTDTYVNYVEPLNIEF